MTEDEARPFVPIRPNPYIVGNPVRERRMFFGREAEFELVRKRCQDADRGLLLVFCGERRSGKTSILFQIMEGRLGNAFIPVLVDMQSMAVASEADFLGRVSAELIAALDAHGTSIAAPEFAAERNHAALFHRLVQDVLERHPGKKLIFLFDEYELFEHKIDSGVFGEDVLHIFATLMENRSVFLIFTGSQHVENRRREYWRILGMSQFKTISYLEKEDAIQLIRKPVEHSVRYGDGVVDQIYRLTAGQPFYTQAVCQSLVDRLNELRTNDATVDILSGVVSELVDNPLPQMMFLWDTLESDERLVLALLSEALPDHESYAGVRELLAIIRQREYPLRLTRSRVATALEKLFKQEILLKRELRGVAGYAFQVDLWRLWIRRMHSVWQVMRELDLSLRPTPMDVWRKWRLGVAFVVIAGAAVLIFATRPKPVVPTAELAWLGIRTVPADARLEVSLEGETRTRLATGEFRERVRSGVRHSFRVTAPGYADSSSAVLLKPGDSLDVGVRLRPRWGRVRIETVPQDAKVTVDGIPRGAGAIDLTLDLPTPHLVEASAKGYLTSRHGVEIRADTTLKITLLTESAKLDLASIPSGAQASVDGVARGPVPLSITNLTPGRHELRFELRGQLALDTTIEIGPGPSTFTAAMRAAAPGILVVRGSRVATIFIDDKIVAGVKNSGPQSCVEGMHRVVVQFNSGEELDTTLFVQANERVVYDYGTRTVVRSGAPKP